MIPDCVGFVDGTLLPLFCEPQRDGSNYYSRKGSYGVAAMVVCDDQKRIRYICCGFPGSAHDQRVLNNCRLSIEPDQFFEPKEYLLSDSGYAPSRMIVSS
jgi:hypothetical protein